MAKATSTKIHCEYFNWRVFQRGGVFYADGRTNEPSVGKHSLATKDRHEAIERLHLLDRQKAVENGLAEPIKRNPTNLEGALAIHEGWQLYFERCEMPEIAGGTTEGTLKRYRAVRDKHIKYCQSIRAANWLQVDKKHTLKYGTHLAGLECEYADRTLSLEMNTVCAVVKWLVEEEHLPTTSLFQLKLQKIDSTDAYCYRREEVTAMRELCNGKPELKWLQNVITALATTGLRISELASLRWSDFDLDSRTLQLTDERHSAKRKRRGNARTTKGKRGRVIPLNPSLEETLAGMTNRTARTAFRGPRGGVLKPDTVRNILIREVITPLVERFPTPEEEIGFVDGRLHSFRHYFVSECFRQGASEGQIMEWVGHKDSQMVRRYRHLRQDDSKRAMDQLQFFEDNESNGPDCPDQ